jgi:hypothetical protein
MNGTISAGWQLTRGVSVSPDAGNSQPLMTAQDLAHSAVSDALPPAGLSPVFRALWFARAGQWDAAHDLCQEITGREGAWIHAYLHREEGDAANAAYWYARAGKSMPGTEVSKEEEWMQLASERVGEV